MSQPTTNDAAKLKPCPMCGNADICISSNGIGDFYAICGDPCDENSEGCGLATSDVRCETRKHAAERWNRRPAPPSPEGPSDGEMLDWLQSLTKGYGFGWMLRESSNGRGMRLYETSREGATPDVRAAIRSAMGKETR